MKIERLLTLLSDGQFHSGEEIGCILNVSRAAIWKQIKKLESMGVEYESVKGKGYRIKGGMELLSLEKIKDGLNKKVLAKLNTIEIVNTIDSTNSYIKQKYMSSPAQGYLCMAECQSAGKGRLGRKWISPFGANLYLSIGWQFDGGVVAMEGLSLAVGVSLVTALEKAGILGVKLKWPNDIVFDEKKLGGVLIEIEGDVSGPCLAVIGVGINIVMPRNKVSEIDQEWVDLGQISQKEVSRNKIATLFVAALVNLLENYQSCSFKDYKLAWEALDAYRGRDVMLTQGNRTVVGVAEGVDDTGALCVKTGDGVRSFSGGEVSLRRLL